LEVIILVNLAAVLLIVNQAQIVVNAPVALILFLVLVIVMRSHVLVEAEEMALLVLLVLREEMEQTLLLVPLDQLA
jgi:hypothetical protein